METRTALALATCAAILVGSTGPAVAAQPRTDNVTSPVSVAPIHHQSGQPNDLARHMEKHQADRFDIKISTVDDTLIRINNEKYANISREAIQDGMFYEELSESGYTVDVYVRGGTSERRIQTELNKSTTDIYCSDNCSYTYIRYSPRKVDYHRVLPSGELGRRVPLQEVLYDNFVVELSRNGSAERIGTSEFELNPPVARITDKKVRGDQLEFDVETPVMGTLEARLQPIPDEKQNISIQSMELSRNHTRFLRFTGTLPATSKEARYRLTIRRGDQLLYINDTSNRSTELTLNTQNDSGTSGNHYQDGQNTTQESNGTTEEDHKSANKTRGTPESRSVRSVDGPGFGLLGAFLSVILSALLLRHSGKR